MSTKTFEINQQIEAPPQEVLEYVADPRNRPAYFPHLKSISDLEGEPTAVGTSWKWTFSYLGLSFEGRGRCLKHDKGKVYAFTTEGGIKSTFTYEAQPAGQGTNLLVKLEYEVPERAISVLPVEDIAIKMRQTEAEKALQNLKTILEK
jgi:carbon monoxide dehydrogenase subunit G